MPLYAVIVSGILLWLRHLGRACAISPLALTRFAILAGPDLRRAVHHSRDRHDISADVSTRIFSASTPIGLSNQNFLQWFGDFAHRFRRQSRCLGRALSTVIYSRHSRRPDDVVDLGHRRHGRLSRDRGHDRARLHCAAVQHYTPLKEGPLKAEILSLARSEGIPATNVYEFDASRQTKRVSANVSGLFGTTRISLNDNLLNRCTPRRDHRRAGPRDGALRAQSCGHPDHLERPSVPGRHLLSSNWGFGALVGHVRRENGTCRGIDDPAGLPVIMALVGRLRRCWRRPSPTPSPAPPKPRPIFSASMPCASPTASPRRRSSWANTEARSDAAGGIRFLRSPSGRTRICMMMRWKAEHLNDPDIKQRARLAAVTMKAAFERTFGRADCAAACGRAQPSSLARYEFRRAGVRPGMMRHACSTANGITCSSGAFRPRRRMSRTCSIFPIPRTIAFGPNTHSFVLRFLSCFPRDRPIRDSHNLVRIHELLATDRAAWKKTASSTSRASPTEPFDTFRGAVRRRGARGRYDLVFLSQVFFDSGYRRARSSEIDREAVPDTETFIVIDGYHAFMAIPVDITELAGAHLLSRGRLQICDGGRRLLLSALPARLWPAPARHGLVCGLRCARKRPSGVRYAGDGSRFLGATFDVTALYRFNAVQEWLAFRATVGRRYARPCADDRTSIPASLDRLNAPSRSSMLLDAG